MIDFIGEVKTQHGATMTNVRDKVDVKLSDATAEELARRPIVYETGFTPLPAETGRIGTYQATFFVPNLNLEQKRVPLSSVVLRCDPLLV